MNSDQQQQKGLFTFYREQADLEQTLKLKKKLIRASKLQKSQEKEKKILSNVHHQVKNQYQSHKKASPSPPLPTELSEKKSEERAKSSEQKDKLIAILQKYNAKQVKSRDNLRIISESQEEHPSEQIEHLKNRLEKLLDKEEKSYFRLIMAQNAINQFKKQQEPFVNKHELIPKLNPFQKLAIIPTSFINEFEDQSVRQPYIKQSTSRSKGYVNSVELRKNERQYTERKERYELNKIIDPLSFQSNRLNLPKIETRVNSQVIRKSSKIKPLKRGEMSYAEPIRSERSNYKPELSLFLDSIKLATDSATSKLQPQNKIYSLFIENKEMKLRYQSKSFDKQIVLSDVLKKLKFS